MPAAGTRTTRLALGPTGPRLVTNPAPDRAAKDDVMQGSRFFGLFLIIVGVALWMMPYYGYERAVWHYAVAVVATIAGATLLFRGRPVSV